MWSIGKLDGRDVRHLSARLLRTAIDTLLPVRCVFCGVSCVAGERHVCDECLDDLPWNVRCCERCAIPAPLDLPAGVSCGACQVSPPPWRSIRAPLIYEFPVDAAIRAFKFRRRLAYAPAFASFIERASRETPDDIDALIPVPLHRLRQARRGFNQAYEIARPVAKKRGLPMPANVIRRRPTRYQSGLDAAARRRNLRDAFVVRGPLVCRHPLIVDDVVTTGATAGALTAALLAAGASTVSILALARAAPHARSFGAQDGLNE